MIKGSTSTLKTGAPNPITPRGGNPYVPMNMPAIGDLFDLFSFPRGDNLDRRRTAAPNWAASASRSKYRSVLTA